jgi:hypothetical protein
MSAIPGAMRLEPKPEAINAYRRRCITNATSSNPYPSRGTIKIPLDTAFPGSMLDTSQTQLSFSLNIVNTNPFVDYFNLPKCGANSVIKELRIMVNGNAVEKNPRYGLCFEDAMNKMGINSEPYEFFSSNEWCPTESKFHCNMIKPSMVDSMGNPMYRSSLFNDAQQRDQLFFGHAQNITTAPNRSIINVLASSMGNFSVAANDALAVEGTNNFSLGNMFGITSGNIMNTASPTNNQTGQFGNQDLGTICSFGVLQTPLDYVPVEGQQGNRGNHTLHTPADWPFFQPGIAKKQPVLSQSRWQDIISFYANCKNIPIGMYKEWKGVTESSTDGTVASSILNGVNCFNSNTKEFVPTDSANKAVTSFRIVTPLLSGILGTLTDKFFPDMLVAAGKMWIEIDLQPKEVALQLLMDPCRRIPGTIRDYVPYSGRVSGQRRDTKVDQEDDLDECHVILGRNLQLPLKDQFGVFPATDNERLAFARNQRLCYSEGACRGEVFVGVMGNMPTLQAFEYDDEGDKVPIPLYTGEDGLRPYQNVFYNVGYGVETGGWAGCTTGVPIPQYFLSYKPWTMKSPGSVIDVFAAEVNACYGTYLRSSVAQTRRTLASTNCKAITNRYTNYDTDYNLTNVILYTEQIIVPDEIASQLLISARNSAISYHTSFVNATYNNAPTNDSQNLLLTVTGASVNSVTFVFQSNVQLAGTEAFAYNSFATYNPWTRLDFSPGESDVGGTYKLENPLTTQSSIGFNLYLKIGNELMPRQAINDIPGFLMETQKGFQTLSDYNIQLDLQTSLVPAWSKASNESYLQYDVLKEGFFSCFVEAKALDDQTLTGNPYLQIQGYDIQSSTILPVAARRRGVAQRFTNDSTDTYEGCLNLFKPLDGNFRMCFNLATFETQSSARCGTPIVNNQLFLQGDKFYFMGHSVDGQQPTVQVTAIYEQDAKIVFEQGGNCLSFM